MSYVTGDEGAATDGWQFAVSSLIDALGQLLTWPVVVLVIFLIVRKPVQELIPRLKSYEGMGQKLAFGEQLAATEETAAAAIGEPAAPESGASPQEQLSPLIREAELNPSFVIISAWEQLNLVLRDIVAALGTNDWKRVPNSYELARRLRQAGLVNTEFEKSRR